MGQSGSGNMQISKPVVVVAKKLSRVEFNPKAPESDFREPCYSCRLIFDDASQDDISIPVRAFKKVLSRVGQNIWFVTVSNETTVAFSTAEMLKLSGQHSKSDSLQLLFSWFYWKFA